MKTIWKFYRLPKDGMTIDSFSKKGIELQISDLYPLYALTHKKKYAKQFMKERDMTQFFMIKDEGIDDEDFSYFANKNRSCVLQKSTFTTYYEEKDKYVKAKVKILTTYAEESYVTDTVEGGIFEDGVIGINNWVNPRLFKNKYYKALKSIKYLKFHDFINAYAHPSDSDEDDSYAVPELTFDQLKVFYTNYQDLFK